jgi:hypothetical protein
MYCSLSRELLTLQVLGVVEETLLHWLEEYDISKHFPETTPSSSTSCCHSGYSGLEVGGDVWNDIRLTPAMLSPENNPESSENEVGPAHKSATMPKRRPHVMEKHATQKDRKRAKKRDTSTMEFLGSKSHLASAHVDPQSLNAARDEIVNSLINDIKVYLDQLEAKRGHNAAKGHESGFHFGTFQLSLFNMNGSFAVIDTAIHRELSKKGKEGFEKDQSKTAIVIWRLQ